MLISYALLSFAAGIATASEVTKTSSVEFTQTSPIWLSNVKGPDTLVKGYPREEDIQVGSLSGYTFKLDLNAYPEPGKQPPVNHPEVQEVLKQLDLSKVPQAKTRVVKDWVLDLSGYDTTKDPDCWWSASLCKKPKVSYVPEDISYCPNKGDWGLNYDDGPYKIWYPNSEEDKEFDQPRFYNFLVEKGKQKATLFFVGSNVVKFPDAAQRALNDGHTICSHTWSHPQMTSLTNEEVVAQLYWTQKAIKEALGITPKCWRPPYGDVDDRVRAIAWQMGMRTILWDQDSYDWNLYIKEGVGHLKPDVIDGYFDKWIQNREKSEHGHITLQHENSNATIRISEKWLPKLQENFRVLPIHHCLNDPKPYWEESWVYPTLDQPNPPRYERPVSETPKTVSSKPNTSGASSTFIKQKFNGIFALSFMMFVSTML